jgi:hypothetical protein
MTAAPMPGRPTAGEPSAGQFATGQFAAGQTATALPPTAPAPAAGSPSAAAPAARSVGTKAPARKQKSAGTKAPKQKSAGTKAPKQKQKKGAPAASGQLAGSGQPAGKARADRRAGRRRTRRIGLVAVGAGVVAAAVVAYELMPGPGPAHVISTPQHVGDYTQAPALAASMQAAQLRSSITSESGGKARHVVDAVYEDSSGPADKAGQQIVLFIGGNRSGSSASSFIASFTGNLQGAVATSPGSLGGAAACVPSVSGRPAECAWADDDTFGLVASPTLSAQGLADELRQLRPQVEHLAK